MSLTVIEVEKRDGGYRAFVVDLSDDAVLFTSEVHEDVSRAVREATTWMEENE